MDKRIYKSGRKATAREEQKKDKKTGGNRDFAAGIVMIAGCVAVLAFFIFASFGKNVESEVYSNYAIDEKADAVSVFSQIIYPDGKTEKSLENTFPVKDSSNSSAKSEETYANAENVFSKEDGSWNFWQYLCDSIAEIFGVTNAE